MRLQPRARSAAIAAFGLAAALCLCAPYSLAPRAVAQQPTAATPGRKLTARVVAPIEGYEGPSGYTRRPALVAFGPGGRLLALSAPRHTVRVVDTATGRLRYTLSTAQKGGLSAFSFSPDGDYLATRDAVDRTVRLWDAATGTQRAALVGRRRNLETKHKEKTLPVEEFVTVPVSPDGRVVLSEREDDLVTAFDAATSREMMTLDHNTESNAVKGALKLFLWNGKVFTLHMSAVYSPDGRRLATANGDKSPKLWDAATGRLIAELRGHKDRVYHALFSPDSRLFATETTRGTTQLWDAETGALRATLRAGEFAHPFFDDDVFPASPSSAFSPDSKTLVTYRTRGAELWDTATGALKSAIKDDTDTVSFTPDSRLLATDGDERASAKLWDVATGRLVRELPKPGKRETGFVLFSPDELSAQW
jgi:WD40 repeat protein